MSQTLNQQFCHVDTRVIDCGANLEQLKKLPDKCIDLVYLDPPCEADGTFKEFWKEFREKLAFEDCAESTQAYTNFMRPRCVELARVLKPSGSFYYHCDWDAKHYIRVMLDPILGKSNFINEEIWQRQSGSHDVTHGSKRLGRAHGVLLLYSGDAKCYYEHLYRPEDEGSAEKLYINVEAETGRRYRHGNLVAQGKAASSKTKRAYEFLGLMRDWRYSKEDMQTLHDTGLIIQEKYGAEPHYKLYMDEIAGVSIPPVWDDIELLHPHGEEHLAYPTQEPLKLLERILEIALDDEGDDDVDLHGGCGTSLVAALNSEQQWIGIGHFTNDPPLQKESAPIGVSTGAA